jgi:hypothetical protein
MGIISSANVISAAFGAALAANIPFNRQTLITVRVMTE